VAQRRALLIGSIPGDNAEQAMSTALRELGPHLAYLPDGETGDRDTWVVGAIKSLRDHPGLEVKNEGDWSSYENQLNFRVKKGHTLTGDELDLGLARAFRESYPVFQRLREESDHAELTFQVGIPGDFDMALFTLGPLQAFTKRAPFTEATARDLTAIHGEAGDGALFQIEVPAEQVFVAKMPPPLRGLMASMMASRVVELAKRAPEGARFGVHLCLGDLGHKALGKLADAGPLTALANAVIAKWPAGRRLEYLHAPLAEGEEPPVVDERFYRPLSRLRLPADTRFVAGFVHENCTLEDARKILGWVETHVGRTVDVAASCGLGRRGAEAAETVMRQAAALCAEEEKPAEKPEDKAAEATEEPAENNAAEAAEAVAEEPADDAAEAAAEEPSVTDAEEAADAKGEEKVDAKGDGEDKVATE